MEKYDVPAVRIRQIGTQPVAADGQYVLYWMTAFRRTHHNFSLQRAVAWATELNKPLVIFEALRCGYRWASDRLHRFAIEGMAANAAALANKSVCFYPYVEPRKDDGKGLLRELAKRACVVVNDDFPCFFLPRMMNAAATQVPVRFELVDSNGLLPMRVTDRVFLRAYDFRRYLQRNLLTHLAEPPRPDPLDQVKLPELARLPSAITRRWPVADLAKLLAAASAIAALPIDHSVKPVATRGGAATAGEAWIAFLADRLPIYAAERNQPERQATSSLSPYLHFGHISVHQVFDELMRSVGWTPDQTAAKATGSASKWWGLDANAESFLDELITWRELGYNLCWQRTDYDQYDSLPEWAQRTLAEHAGDPRAYVYSLEELEGAATHDELWNAAQRQLVREGTIHNYLRMLWGKKILEWSATPRVALDTMIELNNKYALDGRNPNSYSGIFWTLGRYDRAWGPERPIFGKVRYMSSANTARKVRIRQYLKRYAKELPPRN